MCKIINLLVAVFICAHSGSAQVKQWSIDTKDTRFLLAVRNNQLFINEITGAKTTFNFARNASKVWLPDTISVNNKFLRTNWIYKKAEWKNDNGKQLILFFNNESPLLHLIITYEALPGVGPIKQSMQLTNQSTQTLTVHRVESLRFATAKDRKTAGGRVTYISDDASFPDSIGVYHLSTDQSFSKQLRISEGADWIPLMIFENGRGSGMYMGWEWSDGRMVINNNDSATMFTIGLGDSFKTDLLPHETFIIPPVFLGAFKGDLDACGNTLRRYLFNHAMPSLIKNDSSYPKVEWNAFAATGKTPGGWDPVESKYYPLIDDIAPLGFDEVVLDIGWWNDYGDPHHIITDSIDWPSGIPAAAKYAKAKGLRFGLYDNEPENFTTDSGKTERFRDIAYLLTDLGADFYRSDATAKPVTSGSHGGSNRATYPEDVAYWSVKGFYDVMDSLYSTIPGFSWENCAYGGGLKDFGALRRSSKIQTQDVYYPIEARKAFYDGSYAIHPIQLACVVGSWLPWKTTTPLHAKGSLYEFRSSSMGAAYWHPDAPNGGNGGDVWSEDQKNKIAKAVKTYKEKIRPLMRQADLYHIFERPDNIRWDGIQYIDPVTAKGVVYIFKPGAVPDNHVIRLKGLEPKSTYDIIFEDGSNNNTVMNGAELMKQGIKVTLKGSLMSELMFIEKINTK